MNKKDWIKIWRYFIVLCYATGRTLMFLLWMLIAMYILESYMEIPDILLYFGWAGLIGTLFISIYEKRWISEKE